VDIKFKVAIKAVENANLSLDIAKDKHPKVKKEHNKKEGDEPFHLVAKAVQDKVRMESPQPVVVATKTALDNSRKARDDGNRGAEVLGVQIFRLYRYFLAMQLANPGTSLLGHRLTQLPGKTSMERCMM
jgi:hypothetical protein